MFELTSDELRMLKACLVEVLYGLSSMPDAPANLAVAGKRLFEQAPLERTSLSSEDVLIAQYVIKTTLAELVPEAELATRTGFKQLELWPLLDRLNAAARRLAGDLSSRQGAERSPKQLAGYVRIALLGRVRPNLRGVSSALINGKPNVSFVFDGEISDLDLELVSLAETELLSHYGADIEVQSARVDGPGQISAAGLGEWIFLRWEADETA